MIVRAMGVYSFHKLLVKIDGSATGCVQLSANISTTGTIQLDNHTSIE